MASEKHHFFAGQKVIVAGGGIAGLSFAIALSKLWEEKQERPEIVVYDRDAKETIIGRQGNSLSISGQDKDGGLVVLQQLGLLDEILDNAVLGVDNAGSFKIWDQDWNELIKVSPKPYGDLPTVGIRIARKDLRRVLINAAERAGVTIHWGSKCTAARRLENGRLVVAVSEAGDDADSTERECDVLIAADGSHSKIRQSFRPDDGVRYAGASQLGGNARFPDGIPHPIDLNWGMTVTGEGVSCFFSPVDKNTVIWGLSTLGPQPEAFDPKLTPEEKYKAAIKEAKEVGHMYSEPFTTIIEATDPTAIFRLPAMDKEPFSHDDLPRGVIFIGDANHAVSPFAGNGANLALKDGWDLAEYICRSESLDQAVLEYDKLSVPRAQKTLKSSRQRIDLCHCTGFKFMMLRAGLAAGRTFMWLSGR